MTQPPPPYRPPTYGPPYAPPPRQRRSGPHPLVIVLLALGAVIVIGVVGFVGLVAYEATQLSPVTIKGTMTIKDDIDGGTACQGDGGYSDIRGGTEVVIHDAAGKVIATGQLADGVGSDFATDEIALTCTFHFTVRDVPEQDFYGIEVSHRGTVQFSAAQIERGDVELSLGS
jgi:hypothetical protein